MPFSISKDDVWWKHAVFYHIYPLSFFDSNGDGFGDLKGIQLKINYFKELGVDALWLSPVYKSPMFDFGYDVENFLEIDPVFGNMDDFKELIKIARENGLKIIMDLILNHTSINHPWFLESKRSRSNSKRDWYIWKSSNGKRKPNNWRSALGGSAWEFDENTSAYYMHTFLPEQADLNWENTEMQKAFFEQIKYWLDLGVDGFRLDAINMIGKDRHFRNNSTIFGIGYNKKWKSRNQYSSFRIIKDLRKLIDSYNDRVLIGEIYALPLGNPELAASYVRNNNKGLHLAFDFSIVYRYWSARAYYNCFANWYSKIQPLEFPTIVFSNHDLNRSFNRPFTGKNQIQKAIIKAFLQLTLKGAPFIYYGEEIGMPNSKLSKKHLKDPIGIKFWPFYLGRDPARTPMQWNSSKYAGFSNVLPWLPVDNGFTSCNVETQKGNPDSLWNVYSHLIEIRKQYRSLRDGEFTSLNKGEKGVWIYERVLHDESITIALNFTSKSQQYHFNFPLFGKVIYSTNFSRPIKFEHVSINLDPFEATIIKKNALLL